MRLDPLDCDFEGLGKATLLFGIFASRLLLELMARQFIDRAAQLLRIAVDRVDHTRQHQRKVDRVRRCHPGVGFLACDVPRHEVLDAIAWVLSADTAEPT
jgi:hypothetical protein